MREFVPPELAADLVFCEMQRVNVKFHSERNASRREGDVIWRLPLHKGGNIYLCLLIEFQSEIDAWMAVRAQVYQGLLWQQVIDEQKLKSGELLPPVLLLVLYNGMPRWTAATTTHQLIALSTDSTLWPWQPQARYYLLDMGAFPYDELARRETLAALLFRLERQHSPGEFETLLDEVISWFRKHKGYQRLKRLFAELVGEAFIRQGLVPSGQSGPCSLLEAKNMLEIDWEGCKTEYRAKGKAEGKAEALLTLLAEKFGPLGPAWRKRIKKAEVSSLDQWLRRVLVAPDLPSVFESLR